MRPCQGRVPFPVTGGNPGGGRIVYKFQERWHGIAMAWLGLSVGLRLAEMQHCRVARLQCCSSTSRTSSGVHISLGVHYLVVLQGCRVAMFQSCRVAGIVAILVMLPGSSEDACFFVFVCCVDRCDEIGAAVCGEDGVDLCCDTTPAT